LRIVFAGTPEFAVPALEALRAADSAQAHLIAAVYTQPDRPAGSGRKLTASPVKQAAQRLSVPVEQPVTLSVSEVADRLAHYRPDVMVVAAYGLVLSPAILAIPALGCINIHASLLPRWRGADPPRHPRRGSADGYLHHAHGSGRGYRPAVPAPIDSDTRR